MMEIKKKHAETPGGGNFKKNIQKLLEEEEETSLGDLFSSANWGFNRNTKVK